MSMSVERIDLRTTHFMGSCTSGSEGVDPQRFVIFPEPPVGVSECDCHFFRCDVVVVVDLNSSIPSSTTIIEIRIRVRIRVEIVYQRSLPNCRPVVIFQKVLLRKQMQMMHLGAL